MSLVALKDPTEAIENWGTSCILVNTVLQIMHFSSQD
jgi:hypothetical protein